MTRGWGGLLGALLVATGADAQGARELEPSPALVRTVGYIDTLRAVSPPTVDGSLDEEAWRQAPVFRDFRQTLPEPGAAPSQRTEVRVLHDDAYLYFGIICFDTEPGAIDRRLGRRDAPPTSDMVTVFLSPRPAARTGYAFSVNAAGVLKDSLITDDNQFTDDWDAVWDGVSSERSDGWAAELRIPLSLLRFDEDVLQQWGVGVRRHLARTQEVIDSAELPPGANALISRLGSLQGLSGLSASSSLELSPYVAPRLVRRPQYTEPSRPWPRLFNPAADAGLDFRWAPTRDLALVGALNPDFSQLEADQLRVNLSNFELFFQERRPFFTQGMELFVPVSANEGRARQILFYSRRIGLDAPILGAVKLTGTVGEELDIGVLDSLVMGAADPAKEAALVRGEAPDESNPRRQVGFHPKRPFHLGLDDELPSLEPVTRNFLAAVVRRRFGALGSVGGTVAAVTPFAAPCPREEPGQAPDTVALARCRPVGAQVGSLDWTLGTASGEWRVLGHVAGSRVTGGAPEGEVLADGTLLRAGDTGLGAFVRAGKLGGEPLRFSVGYTRASPRLELNRTGYLVAQNEQTADMQLTWVRASRQGWLESLESNLTLLGRWSSDERGVGLAQRLISVTEAVLTGYHTLTFTAGYEVGRRDIWEIVGTGIPVERPNHLYLDGSLSTDPRRSVVLKASGYFERLFSQGASPTQSGGGGGLTLQMNAHPALETRLEVSLERPGEGARFLEALGPGRFLFGELEPQYVTLTLRQLWVITPRLTFQGYGQLFHGSVRASAVYEAAPEPGGPVRLVDLVPASADSRPDFDVSGLNLNLVLRWEYRPGASFYVVYSRTQNGLPLAPSGLRPEPGLVPRGELWKGPATDLLLLKLSWWWAA